MPIVQVDRSIVVTFANFIWIVEGLFDPITLPPHFGATFDMI